MRIKVALSVLLVMWVFIFGGCRSRVLPGYDRPLRAGEAALRKITDPYEIPDFTLACMELTDLRKAVGNSLHYLKKPSSRQFYPISGITHSHAVYSLEAFAELLDSGLKGVQLNEAIRNKFDVYMSVGCDDRGTVLFTGYYTPIFDGSLKSSERFRYPLYKQPADLVKGLNGEILGRRGGDGQISPYPERAVIEDTGMLRGGELIWLSDPFEVYIAHVQGSAKIKMPDGKMNTVGYAGSNRAEYRSISRKMAEDGLISSEQMNLTAMIDYFKRYKDKVDRYVRQNPRYVFFKIGDGPPRGSLNEPVITMRSIATDKSIFPRGALTYIATKLPRAAGGASYSQLFSGFALDQDTGGAIRAPGRCDIYMGQGPEAGKLAGRTYQEGRLYYLFLKP